MGDLHSFLPTKPRPVPRAGPQVLYDSRVVLLDGAAPLTFFRSIGTPLCLSGISELSVSREPERGALRFPVI